ncbi:hypothetical protein GCM10009837_07240 [Streptomyces durmitorensis]|uniref:Uncharacterized protein n=1 Tax=Streptomyces durmitorensis TaxID=319947 RepID=A0ABY4PKS6_9ACTN|nr:hypothetical protein [Streptomyces durmitorensis]UQT54383.1 hypothetical protein M4V62_04370 [Streptomyces durmitorensis]
MIGRRTPEQVAAAHHVRQQKRRDPAAEAKAREIKAEADARAKRRNP